MSYDIRLNDPVTKEVIERNPEDRAFFEKLYPGWTFTDCIVEYPDDNGLKRGTSFFIRMRKEKSNESKRVSKRIRTPNVQDKIA